MLFDMFRSPLRQTAAGLLLACGMHAATQAATVSISASQTSVAVGAAVSVFFDISGLGASAMSLYSFQVNYDHSVLGFSGFNFVNPTSGQNELDLAEAGSFGFSGDVTVASGGVLDVFALSGNSTPVLDADQANDFRFLTLTFNALSVSASSAVALNIGSSLFADALADPLNVNFQPALADITVTAGGGNLPEPGALPLALVALMALVGAGTSMRRRCRQLAVGVVGAAGALLLSGAALAQQAPPVPGDTTIDAVVVKIEGMRLKVRSVDGREFWVTVKSQVKSDAVGKKLTGQASARGDAVLVSNPVFSRAP